MYPEYIGCLHTTYTVVLTIISVMKQAKLRLSSPGITLANMAMLCNIYMTHFTGSNRYTPLNFIMLAKYISTYPQKCTSAWTAGAHFCEYNNQ